SLTGVSWTSVASAGVVGNDASGSGNLTDTITFIPVGGTVTYTVNATIAPNAVGTLSNTATVSGADDTNNANNSGSDTTALNPQATSSLSGSVYVDQNNDSFLNAGEAGIPGVTVLLSGIDAAGNPVNA